MERPNSESCGFGSLGRTVPKAEWRVIVWEEHPDRWQRIGEIIAATGAEPVLVKEFSDLRFVKFFAGCFVAVVSTGAMAGGVGMQVIRHLKAKGFTVIACEDSVGSWPIKTKCLPLVAGAVRLLDSSREEFPNELRQRLERIARTEAQNRIEEQNTKAIMLGLGMVGESAAMMQVFRATTRFSALSDMPVLITGESGTGKEGLARAVHSLDPKRNRGPFVAVNCGAISAALV